MSDPERDGLIGKAPSPTSTHPTRDDLPAEEHIDADLEEDLRDPQEKENATD